MRLFLPVLILSFGCCLASPARQQDTVTTKSGLRYIFTQHGNGPALKQGRIVVQHYTLWLADGRKIESSRDRNDPLAEEYPSYGLIKGMNEALSLMHVGDRALFTLPYTLGYGKNGSTGIPAKATLLLDIEVLDMKRQSMYKYLQNILFYPPITAGSRPQVSGIIAAYSQFKRKGFKDIYTCESDLNKLGYRILKEFPDSAIELFKLNAAEYPGSAAVYYSLAMGYSAVNENDLAIQNVEKSLKIDPSNEVAIEMLRQLKER